MADMWQMLSFALVCVQVVVAAIIDARTRTFPNWLAVALALAGVAHAWGGGGFERMFFGLVLSCCICLLLTGYEILWRRHHGGEAGLGAGDIKFLAAFSIFSPSVAVASFALGLALLALTGLVCRRRSLPLLPFVAVAVPLVVLAL